MWYVLLGLTRQLAPSDERLAYIVGTFAGEIDEGTSTDSSRHLVPALTLYELASAMSCTRRSCKPYVKHG